MHVVVVGAGGVGGYFGARLAASGTDVTFIARGKHFAAIREHGLRVRSGLGDLHVVDARATDDVRNVASADVVLLCVKLWDTTDALTQIAPLVGPGTAVISLQNGVEKEELLPQRLGRESVLGGVCYIAASIVEPGIIQHTGAMQKIVFGEYDGAQSQRAGRLLEACKAAGIDVELSSDIRRVVWEKFVFLVGLSALTAVTRQPIGAIRSHQKTRALLLGVMEEAAAVARASGVALDPGFAQGRVSFCDGLPHEMSASMRNDLEHGYRLELPWLSGDVAARGTALGVETPVNRLLADILSLYIDGRPA